MSQRQVALPGDAITLGREGSNIIHIADLAVNPHHATITSADGRKLLEPFQETKVRRRHLRRGDMPGLLRWIPIPLVERVIGRVVVLKGFKPLTASIPLGKVA